MNNKQNIYEIPEVASVIRMIKFIFEIDVNIFKNYVKIRDVKEIVISSLVGPFWKPRASRKIKVAWYTDIRIQIRNVFKLISLPF